ncbi:polyphenol oxidase family protein [Arthrobacter halodurans]|uniref:Polyphenol oxidase family protein n=1 Tax=Arthrobacter halodurans TaxID=516699 RepID=A0ABV4UIM7_9MICC
MLRYVPAGLPEIRVAFTSSADGNLALHVGDDPVRVADARVRLEERLGLGAGRLRFMDQVHSAATHTVGVDPEPPGGRAPTADALVSPDGGSPLAVMVADCVPVVLVGRTADGAATGVAHAGRAGLLGGVLEGAVRALRGAGAAELQAWIGPSICGACYEVPPDMASDAERSMPGIATTTSRGTPGLDLPGAAARLLSRAGAAVHSAGVCTLEHPAYYSYRRDRATGRFAGLVWRAGDPR